MHELELAILVTSGQEVHGFESQELLKILINRAVFGDEGDADDDDLIENIRKQSID